MADAAIPTLRAVLAALGEAAITVAAAPRGLDVVVAEPVIFDPLDDDPLGPGLVVLGAGCDGAAAEALVRKAGEDGAAAVIFKAREGFAPPVDAATEASVAVLTVPAAFTWGQLLSLLRTAVEGISAGEEAVEGDDLFAVANAIAASLGGPVTIEDRHSRVLAYSSLDQPVDEGRRLTILGRQVPEPYLERLRAEGVFPLLWSSTEPVHLAGWPDSGTVPRLAIALRAGGEVLGSIWVAEGDRPLDDDAARFLRDAAGAAALQLVRRRTRRDLRDREREDALATLLAGGEEVTAAARALELAPDATVRVIGVAPAEPAEPAEAAVRVTRLAGVADLYCSWWRHGAGRVVLADRLYLLLPGTGEDAEAARADRLAAELAERAHASLHEPIHLGVGTAGVGPAHAAVSRAQADRALRVLAAGGAPGPAAAYEVVRARALLLELRDVLEERAHLREGPLADLLRHDAVHGSDYVTTVRAYLDAFGDVPLAAAAITVHPNTFRYRLRRVTELSGLDLDDPSERLLAHLQLLALPPERAPSG